MSGFRILLLLTFLSWAFASRNELVTAASHGNCDEVKYQLFHMADSYLYDLSVSAALDAAYAGDHLDVIQVLVESRPVDSVGHGVVHDFFYRVASDSSGTRWIRDITMDLLLERAPLFNLKYIRQVLEDLDDSSSLNKLIAAAEYDSRIHLYDLNDVVERGEDSLVPKLLPGATEFAIEDALDSAYRQHRASMISRILEGLNSNTKTVYTAHMFQLRIHSSLDPLIAELRESDFGLQVEEMLEGISGYEARNREFRQHGVTDAVIPPMEVVKASQGSVAIDASVKTTSLGALVGNSGDSIRRMTGCDYTVDGGVVIDGLESWDMVVSCLEDSSIRSSPRLVPKNTGPSVSSIFRSTSKPPIMIEYLVLKNMPSLQDIPRDFFVGLTSLTSLTLTNIGLTELPRQVFFPLRNLNHLDVFHNSIDTIPAGIEQVGFLPSLKTLDLTGNPISTGCVPLSVDITPSDIMPSCSLAYKVSLLPKASSREPKAFIPSSDKNLMGPFDCKTEDFLSQPVRQVHKVVGRSGAHYGIVLVFDTGMLLSELVVPKLTGFSRIAHTCARIPIDMESAKDRAIQMFSLRSILRLDLFPLGQVPNSELMKRALGYSLDHIELQETLLGTEVVSRMQSYELVHIWYKVAVSSCVTFAHVLLRDLQRAY